MEMKKMIRQTAVWIACFAMLFAALAPSISHAFSVKRNAPWAEICSVGGMKSIPATSQDMPSHSTMQAEHCPFCATHAGAFALLPNTGFSIPLNDVEDVFPILFFQSLYPLAVWTSAQSRAPPLAV